MFKLESWLEKASATRLRTWLNIEELDKLIEAKGKPKIWVLAQSNAGVRPLELRIEGVAQRYWTTVAGEKVQTDLLLDCKLFMETEERGIQLKASSFIPPKDNELCMLSRIFALQIHRDHFFEDMLFCAEVSNDAALEQAKRNAANFFKRFFDGDNEEEY